MYQPYAYPPLDPLPSHPPSTGRFDFPPPNEDLRPAPTQTRHKARWIIAQTINLAWFIPAALFVMPRGIAGQFDISLLFATSIGAVCAFVALIAFTCFLGDMYRITQP